MIIEPRVRGFICTTAHPEGCAAHVNEWIAKVKKQGQIASEHLPKKVLVIGASTGFGLASRIVAAFGLSASTIGVFFERPAAGEKTASPGWYNTAAFERAAHDAGLYAKSINGDAFSDAIKMQTIELIQRDWDGQVDLVIYSIASPVRIHPKTGEQFRSVLKPIGQTFRSKTVNVMNGEVTDITIEPANSKEIADTIAVMGGDDWRLWCEALLQHNCFSRGAKTVAFTYLGPEITYPIYRQGTIGKAKEDLEAMAHQLNEKLQTAVGGQALISVNKALVTQASAAIPVVPLYISLLYKVMKAKGLHEGCLEQMWRLFHDRLFLETMPTDDSGRIRVDDWEMREDVQTEVARLWSQISTENIATLADLSGYQDEFYRLFGFRIAGVDYKKDTDIAVPIPSVASAS